mgnify:CR=1 FL=1
MFIIETMAMAKRRRFVHANFACILAGALVLALLDSLTYELFFMTSLLSFLIVVELTEPSSITPAWRRRLKWLALIGMLGFVYFVIQRALTVLSLEVF